jgi:hypothetical protein
MISENGQASKPSTIARRNRTITPALSAEVVARSSALPAANGRGSDCSAAQFLHVIQNPPTRVLLVRESE